MFYSIRRFFDRRFERRYYFEVAKYFASNATFTELVSSNQLAYSDDVNSIIEDVFDSCNTKLRELIPKARHVRRSKIKNSDPLLVIKCFATHKDINNVVYGIRIWIKSGKRWITFNHNINDWETVKYIPTNSFNATYKDSCSDNLLICDQFESVRDFYFVY